MALPNEVHARTRHYYLLLLLLTATATATTYGYCYGDDLLFGSVPRMEP